MKTERNPLYSKALSLDDIHDNVPFVVYSRELEVPLSCGVFSGEPFEDEDGIMKAPYWRTENLSEGKLFLADHGIVRYKHGAWNDANVTILADSQGMADFAREFNISVISFATSSIMDDFVAICKKKIGSINILSH